MLDHDRVRQAPLAQPFLQHDANAARVRQDRHQRHVRVGGRELRKVERQPRAHHDRLRARLARGADVGGVFGDRAHHVHGDEAAALGERERGAHFTPQRFQVGGIDHRLVAAMAGKRHEVGMVAPQVHGRERAHGILARDGAREPVGRDAHAHSALHDGKERPAAYPEGRQVRGDHPIDCPGGCAPTVDLGQRPVAWLRARIGCILYVFDFQDIRRPGPRKAGQRRAPARPSSDGPTNQRARRTNSRLCPSGPNRPQTPDEEKQKSSLSLT
jgi:hypothetical protein